MVFLTDFFLHYLSLTACKGGEGAAAVMCSAMIPPTQVLPLSPLLLHPPHLIILQITPP